MTARLSIVVPFFNVEEYVIPCLESLQRQTFGDFEAVLVDDGSTDGTHDLANVFCKNDSRFRIVRQENQGLGPARNTGANEAQGELLTFVDSDDLVPHHAYEQMVRSLDATGSDLVAGDARRFNSLGVRDSFVHREPFAVARPATHVFEFPALALDRMAWNKMYQRRFWDDNGFEFPAILYEDYPVTIKSHVRAKTVDVLAAPVYYWRERDGGEPSITQRKWEIQNLRERVASAESVLDFLEEEAPQLRPTVEKHLLQVDVSALAGAVHENDESEHAEIVDLAVRLSQRMLPSVIEESSAFDRVQNHLLVERRLDELKTLIAYRANHGVKGRVVREGILRPKYYLKLPFFEDAHVGIKKGLYAVDPRQFDLRATVEDLYWENGELHVDLFAHIESLPMTVRSTVSAWFENKSGTKVKCAVTRYEIRRPQIGRDLSGVRLTIDPTALAGQEEPLCGFWALSVKLKSGGITRIGTVGRTEPGRGKWSTYCPLTDRIWAQPQVRRDGRFGLWIRYAPHVVERCETVGDEVEVVGSIGGPVDAESAVLRLKSDAEMIREFPVRLTNGAGRCSFVGRVQARDLILHGDHDDPVEERSSWIPRLVVRDEELVLAVHRDYQGAASFVGSRTVAASRTPHGNFSFVESYAHPMITDALWTTREKLDVRGIYNGNKPRPVVVLRRFVTPGNPVGFSIPVTFERDTFSCSIDAAELIQTFAQVVAQAQDEGHAATPWYLLFSLGGADITATMSRPSAWRTAEPRVVSGEPVRVAIGRGDVFRLIVG